MLRLLHHVMWLYVPILRVAHVLVLRDNIKRLTVGCRHKLALLIKHLWLLVILHLVYGHVCLVLLVIDHQGLHNLLAFSILLLFIPTDLVGLDGILVDELCAAGLVWLGGSIVCHVIRVQYIDLVLLIQQIVRYSVN
jgi:hypothetical protein